jgi:hypothetical protein
MENTLNREKGMKYCRIYTYLPPKTKTNIFESLFYTLGSLDLSKKSSHSSLLLLSSLLTPREKLD